MTTFETIQTEMVSWQEHNFPGRPGWIPLMGMVEEIGELVEASLVHDEKEVLDAIGDVCIYLADYCNERQFNMSELWIELHKTITSYHWKSSWQVGLQIEIGKLAHAHIKEFQQIRMHENHPEQAKKAITAILFYLDRVAQLYQTVVETVALDTWQKVRQRDWQKNRNTAHKQQQTEDKIDRLAKKIEDDINKMEDRLKNKE